MNRSAQLRAPSLGYREDKGGRAAVAFVMRHIINREGYRSVIINNRPRPVRIRDGCAARVTQMNGKRFIRLKRRISIHQHGDLLTRLIRGEGERSAIALVVVVRLGGSSVHRLEIHRRAQPRAPSLGHREDVRRCPRIALIVCYFINREAWSRIIVHDCGGPICITDRRVGRCG